MESYLSDYTEPKRFCPRILNLEGFCPRILNLEGFCPRILNLEEFCLLNPELQVVLCSIILNRKGSVSQC
jgi:hypothetical protein